MKNEDGGYFGLKGYSFQYITSMLKILETDDEKKFIDLEKIEDIGTESELIQVKYKEKGKFNPSVIKKPILKLLEEMKMNGEKLLTLYCYFDDIENSKEINGSAIKLDSETKIPLEYLDKILGNKGSGFSSREKEQFISQFSIVFTKKYDEKFSELIEMIQKIYSCNEDTALVYYSCFFNHLVSKVVQNSTENYELRKCNKKELSQLVETSKTTIVSSHLENILGKEKYYSIVRKNFELHRKPDNVERIFVIDVEQNSSSITLVKISKKISQIYFVISQTKKHYRIDSPAPYIYFREIADEQLLSIKKELYSSDYVFLDGHPYLGSAFLLDSITTKSNTKSQFKLKIINDNESFKKVIGKLREKTFELYELYHNEIKCSDDCENIDIYRVKVERCEDIFDYLLK